MATEELIKKIDELGKIIVETAKIPVKVEGLNGRVIKGDKGEKGDKGDKGDPGNDGKVVKGNDGKDGKDGNDGLDGKDGSPDSAEDIRNKLELLDGDERLDAKAIKNLPENKTIVNNIPGGNTIEVFNAGSKVGSGTGLNFTGTGFVLSNNGHITTINLTGGASIGTPIGSGTPNGILYVDASGNLAENATGFYYNGSVNLVGLSLQGSNGGGSLTINDSEFVMSGTRGGKQFFLSFDSAGSFNDGVNTVKLADGTYAVNATGDVNVAGKETLSGPLINTASSNNSTDGETWNDSTQKARGVYESGMKQMLSGTIFTQTADKTVTNTASETSIIGTGIGTLTLPSNFFVVGKTIRLRIGGIYSTPIGTPSVTVKVKYGSTVLASVATSSLLSGASALEFDGEVSITCRSVGSNGSVMLHGDIEYSTGVSGTIAVNPLNNAGAATTINTTTSNLLDVTVTWDSASSTRIATSTVTVVEVLN